MKKYMKKKYIIPLVITILVVLTCLMLVPVKKTIVLDSGNSKYKVYLEQTAGIGDYALSLEKDFPTTGYTFNSSKSKCTNGSTVISNGDNTYQITVNKVDRCVLYFDKTGGTRLSAKRKTVTTTTLLSGKEFNEKIKKLANSEATFESDIEDIKGMEIADKQDDSYSSVEISTEDSTAKAYAWFGKDAKIYLYLPGNITYLNEDASYMFYNLNITGLDLSNIDTSKMTNASYMFAGNTVLNDCETEESGITYCKLENFKDFNTSNVTTMSNMFNINIGDDIVYLDINDIKGWDVTNVVDFSDMFKIYNYETSENVHKQDGFEKYGFYSLIKPCEFNFINKDGSFEKGQKEENNFTITYKPDIEKCLFY